MEQIKVQELAKNIFYMENVFTEHEKIVSFLEAEHQDSVISSILPNKWEAWVHGNPEISKKEDGSIEVLGFSYGDSEYHNAGYQKFIDWDFQINDYNNLWPRKLVDKNYSQSHREAFEFISLIDEPYQKAIDMWSRLSGVSFDKKWISKNYTIKKYNIGGGVGEHEDINVGDKEETRDWTVLIYLTGDYEGGELVFPELNIKIKPSAGSVLFFPCEKLHAANGVISGLKMFIFMYIHSSYGISTSIKEFFQGTTSKIKEHNDATE